MGKSYSRKRTYRKKTSRKHYAGKRKYTGKRKSYRRRSGGNLGGSRNNAIAATRKCTLTYHDTISLDPGAGLYATYSFGANALYDPDITGTGHQPLGYDNWMAMYKYCTVIGSKITVTPTQSSIANQQTGYLTIFLDSANQNTAADIFGYGGTNTLFESQQRKGNIIHYGEGGAGAWNYRENRSVSCTYSANKFHKKKVMSDVIYRNSVSANPGEVPKFNVTAFSVAANNPAAQACEVQIEYVCVFSEPIAIIGS